MQILRSISALIFICLAACSTPSVVETVHVPAPVLPPTQYLTYCPSQASDGSIGQELLRLDALVRCERAGKDAIKTWSDKLN